VDGDQDAAVSLVALRDMRNTLIKYWEAFEMAQEGLEAFLKEDKYLDLRLDAYLAVLVQQEALDTLLEEKIATKEELEAHQIKELEAHQIESIACQFFG